MIRQKIGGRTVNTVTATGTSADLLSLASLLEGELTTYEKKFEGGTSVPSPAVFNSRKFSVGKKYLDGQAVSASVSIPHIKTTLDFNDIRPAVIGSFDESFESSVKCAYAMQFYGRGY